MTFRLATSDEQNAERGESLFPVFCYGTLRVGQGNFQWAQDAVSDQVENCTAEGSLYFAWSGNSYPVAKFDEPGVIKGDLLYFIEGHPETDAVIRMEVGAGYEMQDIEVTTPDGKTIEAFGFHYKHDPDGDHIASGDWIRESNRDVWESF